MPTDQGNLSTEEKGYIAGGVGIIALLMLMTAVGPGAFIPAILIAVNVFLAIMSVVAAVLLIYAHLRQAGIAGPKPEKAGLLFTQSVNTPIETDSSQPG